MMGLLPWLAGAAGKAGTWLKGVPEWLWLALFAAMGLWIARRDGVADARRENELKNARAREAEQARARAYTDQMKEDLSHVAEKALESSRSGEPLDSRRMSDAEFYRAFGYRRTPREVSYRSD